MNSSLLVNRLRKKYIWIISIIIICIILALVGLNTWLFNDSIIYPNIFIESVHIGGLTPEDAKLRIKEIFEDELDNFSVEIGYEDRSWKLSYVDLGVYYVLDDHIHKAYGIGRSGNYFDRIKKIMSLRKNPEILPLEPYYDPFKVESIIVDIKKAVNKEAVNAEIQRKNDDFVIVKEILGVEVDENALKKNIITALKNNNNNPMNIPIKYTNPPIMEETLATVKDIIGEFTTYFNIEQKGRVENIKLAVNSINNTLLMPGEEFSFNDSTGPRSVEEGYQEASVIVNGEFVPGIGGGICQVSTTLYQAALRSNTEITSRRNHGLPVGYVPMGYDATVAYGYIDFKFKNNKDDPIYIESYIDGDKVSVKLYSKKTDNISIDLKSEIIEVVEPKTEIKKDSNLSLGERKVSKSAKKGYRVATYKIYLKDGKEINRELITKDFYPPVHGVVIEGTKE